MSKAYWKTLSKQSPDFIAQAVRDDQDLKLKIYDNMQTYAGSFVKALSEAMLRADPTNCYILCNAFMEYIIAYLPEKWERGGKDGE